MRLQDIGFYTLSDERAATASSTSRLSRAELILGETCNLKGNNYSWFGNLCSKLGMLNSRGKLHLWHPLTWVCLPVLCLIGALSGAWDGICEVLSNNISW
jgi:hypothetical protein